MSRPLRYYFESFLGYRYFFSGLYVFILLLCTSVSVRSFGYDDEFFNINLVERLGWGAISYLQHADIHPPASYIINTFLFELFHNWTITRLFSGLLLSCSLVWVIDHRRRHFGRQQALVIFLLLALNPALLMWCTGVRWYAYFLPVLMYLVFQQGRNGFKAWIKALAAITLLAYTEYSAFLMLLPVLLLMWTFSTDTTKNKLSYLFGLSAVFLALYAYQLSVFFTVHIKNKALQVNHSLIANLRGYFISQVSNQGVFPVSIPALLSLAGCAGILFCIVKYRLKSANQKTSTALLIAYLLVVISLVAAGVAWKPRNLILLIPFQVLLIAHYYTLLKGNKIYTGAIILIAIANICGCFNVCMHKNTTKNSWNLPIKELIAEVARVRNNDSTVVIFTYDPTLTYALQQNKFKVVSLYNNRKTTDIGTIKTAIFINTFRGSFYRPWYDSLRYEESSIQNTHTQVVKLGYDRYYEWKRKLAAEYPEYQAELVIYENPAHLSDLIYWNKKWYKGDD
jgi:hypothetical protein